MSRRTVSIVGIDSPARQKQRSAIRLPGKAIDIAAGVECAYDFVRWQVPNAYQGLMAARGKLVGIGRTKSQALNFVLVTFECAERFNRCSIPQFDRVVATGAGQKPRVR